MSQRSSWNSQQGESGLGSLLDSYRQKAWLRLAPSTVVPLALRTAKHHVPSSIRTISGRIRRPKNCDQGDAERGREMQWARVAADEERRPPSESDQLRQGTLH